jgi:hypothetical protein
MLGKAMWRRTAGAVVVAGLVFGISTATGAVPPSLPSGTVVTCTQISGVITLRPGIGLTGTSSGVKWQLKAVANNCSIPANSAGVVPTNVVAGIVTGAGFFTGGNTCAAAQVAANYGASKLKIQWIASPTVAPTIFSPVAAGAFLPGTTTDASGLTQNRNHVGLTPVNLQLGGDWTAASAAQLAADCSGPAPILRSLFFQTPTIHTPAFVATI